jgi:CelD/BcsL family acetyltransferase involved in cellulose biosynthesis
MVSSVAPSTSQLVELDSDDDRWLKFTSRTPGATIVHQPPWLRTLSESYGFQPRVLVQFDADGEIAAGLPFVSTKRLLRGPVLTSLPFTDSCAPLARDGWALRSLTAALERWLSATEASGIEIRGGLTGSNQLRSTLVGFRHVLSLSGDDRDLQRRMTPSAMRHVRGARRAGVKIRFSNSAADLPIFYRLHLVTRRRLGVPIQPRRFLTSLWRHVVEPGFGFLAVAEAENGEPIAATVVLAENGVLLYKYSASDPQRLELKPNHLIVATVAEWGREHGYSVFDFGRTELQHEGLRRFKRSWGAEEIPLEYTYWPPRAGAASPIRRLQPPLRVLISHSPPLVCRAIGEVFYRYAA